MMLNYKFCNMYEKMSITNFTNCILTNQRSLTFKINKFSAHMTVHYDTGPLLKENIYQAEVLQ